jgi:hypothetical protein
VASPGIGARGDPTRPRRRGGRGRLPHPRATPRDGSAGVPFRVRFRPMCEATPTREVERAVTRTRVRDLRSVRMPRRHARRPAAPWPMPVAVPRAASSAAGRRRAACRADSCHGTAPRQRKRRTRTAPHVAMRITPPSRLARRIHLAHPSTPRTMPTPQALVPAAVLHSAPPPVPTNPNTYAPLGTRRGGRAQQQSRKPPSHM